ncbi:MAG: YcgN family cysteine cluster protein [Halothiobacillaceae bacterium]|jgi:uncharacterized cysteine cluster protein YcgN (CxxCxxCC family)|nr:YcgN family cysteine cluster protein [Halothiobacillaceae bacterium]
MNAAPWWETTAPQAMSEAQWESLCDGCGLCCLHKIDEGGGVVHYTDVACRLLDPLTARCRDYAQRETQVPGCERITPDNVAQLHWLPPTCAYRLIAAGQPLPDWHPLICGDARRVHGAIRTVIGRVVEERRVRRKDMVHRIVQWWPRA